MRNAAIFCCLLWMFGCKKDLNDKTRNQLAADVVKQSFYGPEDQTRVDCIGVSRGVARCSSSDRRMFSCSVEYVGCDGRPTWACIEEFSEFQRAR